MNYYNHDHQKCTSSFQLLLVFAISFKKYQNKYIKQLKLIVLNVTSYLVYSYGKWIWLFHESTFHRTFRAFHIFNKGITHTNIPNQSQWKQASTFRSEEVLNKSFFKGHSFPCDYKGTGAARNQETGQNDLWTVKMYIRLNILHLKWNKSNVSINIEVCI